jgi:tetratricopeptide (TPR) repeat protein
MDESEREFTGLVSEAGIAFQAGKLPQAEAAYRSALTLRPDHSAVRHNLGVVVAAETKHRDALALFDGVIARQPRYVPAHYYRAVALQALGQTKAAIDGFTRTCTLQPDHYDAHRALAFLWLSLGDRGRSLDHFARTYELRRGDDRSGIADKSLTHATRSKLRHDAEQFRYLAERRRHGQRFAALARSYDQVAGDFADQPAPLSQRQLELLGDDYNRPIFVRDSPELPGAAVGERADRARLTQAFRDQPPGTIQVDNVLTPEGIEKLRRHLLESTIWHDFSHIGGFVASYLEDGLACPLVLQIADELRSAFPDLLGGHTLSQAWAFKGLQSGSAVDVHADDATVSVNLWVTPTEACLNPDRSGLVICRVPPPADWAIEGYDSDQKRIVTFLEQNAGDGLIVPYRANRAALFESRLFHYSDQPIFREGYTNHRINMTFLFGRLGPNGQHDASAAATLPG